MLMTAFYLSCFAADTFVLASVVVILMNKLCCCTSPYLIHYPPHPTSTDSAQERAFVIMYSAPEWQAARALLLFIAPFYRNIRRILTQHSNLQDRKLGFGLQLWSKLLHNLLDGTPPQGGLQETICLNLHDWLLSRRRSSSSHVNELLGRLQLRARPPTESTYGLQMMPRVNLPNLPFSS